MSHIFISYSRKDVDFAGKIVQALAEKDLDTWIDWKSIPKGEYWEQEIYGGIEEADAFLFLMSPDSVRSQMCNREIGHALENSKRILPIVIRDADVADFHDEISRQEISKRNWIFCRAGQDNFITAVEETLRTIHTDFEWLKYHTRLQVQALEWERNQHENSFLLHGKELQDAEFQLAVNSSKEPYPTDLQHEYVFKSRQVTDKTRRGIITALINFSAIVLALLIFSLIQLNISRATQLGFQAQAAFAQQNYNAALLYAYQSNQIHKNDTADFVLSQIVYENFAIGRELSGHRFTRGLAWSEDGQLASGSDDNSVIIWDLKTWQPTQVLKGHRSVVTDIAWSKDGKLASASEDNTVILWNLQTGQPAQILNGHTETVIRIAWSEDGQLASGSSDDTVILWDLKTGRPAETLKGHSSYVYDVAWSKDGRLASASYDGSLILWDFKTEPSVQTFKGSAAITSLAWSKDGKLASGLADSTVTIWNLQTGQPAQILKLNDNIPRGNTNVAWSYDGQLASISTFHTVILWDLQTGQPAQTLKESASTGSIAWSRDGRLAAASNNSTVIIWDIKTGQLTQTFKGDMFRRVAWSEDGQLASGSYDGTVTIWDLKTGKPAQTLEGHNSPVTSLAWSEDGQLASGEADNNVIIWDLKTDRPAHILKGHAFAVSSVAWSADGYLASGSLDGTVIIWDLKTDRPAHILKGHASSVQSIAWYGNGLLASGSSDQTIKIAKTYLATDPCANIIRNMTIEEWLAYQGILYVYRPACANLYNPVEAMDLIGELKKDISAARERQAAGYPLPETKDINALLLNFYLPRFLITWRGRILILGIALCLSMIVAGFLGLLRTLISCVWGKIKIIHRKEPGQV